MSSSQSIAPALHEALVPSIHFHRIGMDDRTTPLRTLGTDEAYAVPSFELAEELIARGADSARIAISPDDSTEDRPLGYSQAAGHQLIPFSPFDFKQSIIIVLPTYNERANLEALVQTISRYLVADILIVDDNSPDGTGELADQLSNQYGQVHVLHR